MRLSAIIGISLVLAVMPLGAVTAFHPNCTPSSVSNYGHGSSAGGQTDSTGAFGVGFVTVTDTNAADCDGDGTPGDWDGDYDAGVGGAAFGYGPWAEDPDCNYGLHLDGPKVNVNDFVWGNQITFDIGEDDQSGPIKVQDPVTLEYTCTTDGNITPCPAAPTPCGPTDDADDCLASVTFGALYVGEGVTCGTGGGDGLYWVFLVGGSVGVSGTPPGHTVTHSNPPTTGTITAS